jgi:regulator of sigma E protease
MLGVIIGILMFMFLVMIHEFGHYFAAKRAKVKVLEFGIGIPPKIKALFTDRSGTQWTLNWIPLGWFVRLKGEDPASDDFLAPDSFITAKLWPKLVILFAGVTVNAIFAWLAFSIAFIAGVKPINIVPENMIAGENHSLLMPSIATLEQYGFLSGDMSAVPATIAAVLPDSLAANAGILSGDTIIQIGETPVDSTTLGTTLKGYINDTFTLSYDRNGDMNEVSITCTDQCLLGVQIAQTPFDILPIQFPIAAAFAQWGKELLAQTKLTRWLLGRLGSNLISFDSKRVSSSVNQLSWPVGIVKMGDMILQHGGIWMYLAFAGMISLALAIFNLLPIPALDGGRAVGVIIQSLFGFKPEKYFAIEWYLNMIVFILLMGLGIYIIWLDLIRFWWVSIPFLW